MLPKEESSSSTTTTTKTEPVVVNTVVMRHKSAAQDTSKRQTISGGIGAEKTATPFGERKLVKRSSWVDSNRNWEDLEKETKDKDSSSGGGVSGGAKNEEKSNNEFSAVFSKFQRRVTQQKKDVRVVDVVIDSSAESSGKCFLLLYLLYMFHV